MNQNINDLAKALRDAADSIEKKVRFAFTEDIDLAQAVELIDQMRPPSCDVKLVMTIIFPYGKTTADDPITVEFNVDESYKTKAKSDSFAKCVEAYAVSREGKDSLASVARLVKAACKVEDASVEAVATAPEPATV